MVGGFNYWYGWHGADILKSIEKDLREVQNFAAIIEHMRTQVEDETTRLLAMQASPEFSAQTCASPDCVMQGK